MVAETSKWSVRCHHRNLSQQTCSSVPRIGRMSATPTAITREQVRHLADLARIDLEDAELDHLAPQLSAVKYFASESGTPSD